MRELIYLSEGKLGQFRQERRRGLRVREIGVPGIGQVGVEPNAGSHLDDVIDHLSGIARWYQEDGLAAGDWVQFETTLSYAVLAPEDTDPVLFFAEAEGPRRLVLHGSPRHLVGVPSPPVTDLPWSGLSTGPGLRAMLNAITGHPRLRDLFQLLGDPFDPDLAVPMTGYARKSFGGFDSSVVASPLFVAYARQ